MRIPEKFSWARLDTSPNRSCTLRKMTRIRAPTTTNKTVTTGNSINTIAANVALVVIINAEAVTIIKIALAIELTPGP